MERLLKLYIRYSFFIILLYSCKEKNCKEIDNSLQSIKIEGDYLDTARDVIIEGLYNGIHSRDTTYKDEFIELFKMLKDSSHSIYYGNINEGLATWYYCSTHSNLRFMLVRNSVGKFYYVRKYYWWYLELIELYYFKDNFGNIEDSKDFILRSFDLTSLSNEVKVINQILREEPRLRNNVKSRYSYIQKIDLINNFLYNIYQQEPDIINVYGDGLLNFKFLSNLKKNLLEMQFDRPDTANVEGLIKNNDYEKLAYYYPNKKAIFLRKKYVGIFVFIVHYSKEEDYFYLEKHFIPSCKIDDYYSILLI